MFDRAAQSTSPDPSTIPIAVPNWNRPGAKCADRSYRPDGMIPADAPCGSGLPEKLKVAVAVAIAARKRDARNASTNWKERALSARTALMKVSRTLKASANGSAIAIQAAIHSLAKFESVNPMSQVVERQASDDREKAEQLASFITAIGALNAILDMREGKLSRIWERNAMCQLSNSLCDSLLGLPDSCMTDKTLNSACSGVMHVARQGCSGADVESLADRLLQCMLAASHPGITIDVMDCKLDLSPQRTCMQKHACRPRVSLVTGALSTLSQDARVGSTLLHRACRLQSWLLGVIAMDNMFQAMHAAACSMTVMEPMQELVSNIGAWLHTADGAGTSNTSKINICHSSTTLEAPASRNATKPMASAHFISHKEVVRATDAVICLCQAHYDRLEHLPALRGEMRKVLCTVTAALQAYAERSRSQKLADLPERVSTQYLPRCRDLLLKGSMILHTPETSHIHESCLATGPRPGQSRSLAGAQQSTRWNGDAMGAPSAES
eukprot:jgi/Ulvmu1/2745/UM014_0202.1